jgi:hypothetical protein
MIHFGQTVKIQAVAVGPVVASPHRQLDLHASTGEGVARLDGLNTVRPFHGEANVGQVEKVHYSGNIS